MIKYYYRLIGSTALIWAAEKGMKQILLFASGISAFWKVLLWSIWMILAQLKQIIWFDKFLSIHWIATTKSFVQ